MTFAKLVGVVAAATVTVVVNSSAAERVAVAIPPNQNPYIGAWNPAFTNEAKAKGLEVKVYNSPYDAALQAQQIDSAIAEKVSAIVVDALDANAVIPALSRAKAANIPVFTVITPIAEANEDMFVSFIGPDDTVLGRLAGENIIAALGSSSKPELHVAAVTGFASQLGVQRRMAGFKSILQQHPKIKLVAQEDGRWNTAASEKVTDELLIRFAGQGGLDGIFGMADNQAAGVIQAIQSAGLKAGSKGNGIVVVSSNCMRDGVANIKAGKQYGTNSELPSEEGKAAADVVAAYFSGQKPKKYEYVPSHSITAANIDTYAAGCSY